MTARGGWWWAALVAPVWLALLACTLWEPILRDGWAHAKFHLWNDLSPARLVEYVRAGWLESNPRLGQTLTMLLYTPGPYHAIATPLVELAMFYLLSALALGRWPSVRRADDARAALVVTALVAVCTPQIGPMLFYRPFTGNYLYGFVLNVLWLVPYRFAAARAGGSGWWWALPFAVLGVAAGACNEHTGPAFLALGAAATWEAWRRDRRLRAWMVAGLLGLLTGYLLLLFAPGQSVRYAGLAAQAGIGERILARGVGGNLAVVARLVQYLAPALPWLVLAVIARRRRWAEVAPAGETRAWLALVAGGVLCALTLLASPKLGPRLYLAPVALIAVALAGWVCHAAASRAGRRFNTGAAAVAVVGVFAICLWVYRAVGPIGAARWRLVSTSAYGTAVVVPAYPIAGGRWFLGDDFVNASLRDNLAADFQLASIAVAGNSPPR